MQRYCDLFVISKFIFPIPGSVSQLGPCILRGPCHVYRHQNHQECIHTVGGRNNTYIFFIIINNIIYFKLKNNIRSIKVYNLK